MTTLEGAGYPPSSASRARACAREEDGDMRECRGPLKEDPPGALPDGDASRRPATLERQVTRPFGQRSEATPTGKVGTGRARAPTLPPRPPRTPSYPCRVGPSRPRARSLARTHVCETGPARRVSTPSRRSQRRGLVAGVRVYYDSIDRPAQLQVRLNGVAAIAAGDVHSVALVTQ
jgi:hypothetical protein